MEQGKLGIWMFHILINRFIWQRFHILLTCSLWSFDPQAKTSGKFSDEELQSLLREFQHHKDKINEYNIVMDTVSRTEGKV